MNYRKLQDRYLVHSVLISFLACASAGITAAISLVFIPHAAEQVVTFITILLIVLFFMQIPFVINPIQKAYQDSQDKAVDNTLYLNMMNKTNYCYILTAVIVTLFIVMNFTIDEAGFYAFGIPVVAIFAYAFFASITMIIQLLILKRFK